MKLTFGSYVLADITASPRVYWTPGNWSGQSVTQKEELAGGFKFQAARGNVIGQFSGVSKCSYLTEDAAILAVAAAYSMLGATADLKCYNRSGVLAITWPGAILEDVRKQVLEGLRAEISFTFSITTQTIASL